MGVQVGEAAPDFVLTNSSREQVSLDTYAGKYLVLAFYPLAFTGGCTKEMHQFGEELDKFKEVDAEVVDVSVDNWASAGKFAEQLCVTFPLLSDFPKNKTGQDYGVYDDEKGYHRRTTFVISPDRKVIGTHSSPPDAPESHPDAALTIIKEHKGS